ncbi:hypothetical protein [Burkholderia gladioli]|uniref:hypothetical protein n=1 Tax=Burkholderia gladioli TaxID=28095 RepID=UPI00163E9111|nr:hypothetical protein [Burkholderia gladioli]
MPFTIEQITPLELFIEGEEGKKIIKVQSGELREVGDHKVVGEPQFKEDREERLVVFRGKVEQGAVEVHVLYSLGMDGRRIEDVEVVTIPSGLKIHSAPEFETRDCEDDD